MKAALRDAVEAAGASTDAFDKVSLEPPKEASFGDFATNAALIVAKSAGSNPREFAERLGAQLEQSLGAQLTSWEVAGPGFLNLTLGDAWYSSSLEEIRAAGESFGSADQQGEGEKVIVEFVSANPTGPLTAAGGRHAAYGDSLARILEFSGNRVEREYYVNDAGAQVNRLGQSIIARANGEEVPEDGYSGDYVIELANEIPDSASGDPDAVARVGVEILVGRIKATLERYGVQFDKWFSEATLHDDADSRVTKACDALQRGGHVFTEDGALWLRSTDFGDDKDRVLVRSGGQPTYFAADIAYHADKLARADQLIDVWGADHHGYMARMHAAVEALGDEPERLELVIMQFVNLVEGGDRAQMSKRRGDFVTLDDLLDEIGVDAARWFMLQRSHDTMVDLDLDLARERSAENPVYYVQYAHARAASVIDKAGVGVPAIPSELAELHDSEKTLIRRLASWPEELAEAAERRAPHRICAFALVLAQEFTAFYRDCRIVGAPDNERDFRIALADAAKTQIATALTLLGVSAPNEL